MELNPTGLVAQNCMCHCAALNYGYDGNCYCDLLWLRLTASVVHTGTADATEIAMAMIATHAGITVNVAIMFVG